MIRTSATALIIALLAAALVLGGCVPAAEDSDTPAVGTPVESPADDADAETAVTPEVATVPDRPTVTEAEAAILEIARQEYPDIPAQSATVVGTGQDSQGRWWFQAWTDHGAGYESEQWFVIYDSGEWTLHDYGTGMERTDYPSDIAWEDVP